MKLWGKVLIGLALGALTGLIIGPKAIYLKPLGTLFLNLINMVIVLLVFASMVVGVTSVHDPKKLGRLGGRTLGYYFVATLIAILTGLLVANLFQVGSYLDLKPVETVQQKVPVLSDILIGMIPTNPLASLVNGNILQVIVFAIFLGIAINLSGEKGKPLLYAIQSLADVLYRLTAFIMEFSPIGVFGIMAWVTGTFGLALLIPLFKFLGAYYLACAIHAVVVYFNLLRSVAKVNIRTFLKDVREALIMAFSTCSSAATLPVAMQCLQENVKVSSNVSSFVMPLGLTFNMNGTAIFQAMSAVFVANAYGISLDMYNYITLTLTTILSAVGTAGVPGGGFIMLTAVLASVGLPIEGLAILAGIDRLREMVTTTLNIFGDTVVTVCIARQEGELNAPIFIPNELVESID